MGFPASIQTAKKGLLLVGHGTQNSNGLAEFWAVARQVAELAGEFLVESCFLELAEPSIPEALERLLRQGVERLTVVPLLLFAAGHAKHDIPAAVQEGLCGQWSDFGELSRAVVCGQKGKVAKQKAEGRGQKAEDGSREELQVEFLGALECHERIVQLSAQRFAEALHDRPHVPAAETLHLLVGRGSSHADAIAAMQRFAALRAQETAVDRVEVCFAAVATPTLKEALKRAALSEYRRIVVQPHLLFTGEVLRQIGEAVSQWSVVGDWKEEGRKQKAEEEGMEKEWIIASHLGPSPLVAQAVVEMARSA
ncbi:MAG TPA: sirohydrochlorin chelatase [Pirellulales bacterium]|nr:sirohydrochlorin chelatase [Pirellulales bacterium]